MLFFTRILVGVGEGGYGPAAPTILADLFPIETRGRIMSLFFAAIPVGSALGYVIGGAVLSHLTFVPEPERWRWALCIVAAPGIALGLWCLFQRDPRAVHGVRPGKQRAKWSDYLTIIRTPSYLFNCGAQTAMTFAAGGIGWWIAAYLKDRGLPSSSTEIFGIIIAVAGLTSTLTGGWLADRLRKKYPGSYFLVSGWGMLCAFPLFVGMLFTPFPFAWLLMFGSVFFLFLNTGPSNTALANVSLPKVRATAFAFNILILHLFGDVPAFPAIGYVAGHTNWTTAFLVVSGMMVVAAILWLIGAKFLARDTARVAAASA
jgi:MFS family permease